MYTRNGWNHRKRDGSSGATGPTGATGATGPQGPPGEDGITTTITNFVRDTYIDETLVIEQYEQIVITSRMHLIGTARIALTTGRLAIL